MNDKKRHPYLIKLLAKLGLKEDTPPNIVEWQKILDKISQTYTESDQDKYLNQRSMEISSKEMMDLNKKLEDAQTIAKIGYWYRNIETDEHFWSKELREMVGLTYDRPVPSIEEVTELIHKDDRSDFVKSVNEVLTLGKGYDIYFRIRKMDENGRYIWLHVIGRVSQQIEDRITEVTGIAMDVTKEKHSQIELEKLHQELLVSARLAGMGDIAASVLHNVGNVLNSANVSIGLLIDYFSQLKFDNLQSAVALLKDHQRDLGDYLENDPKGKLLIKYLIANTDNLENLYKMMVCELESLKSHVDHIKDITRMQEQFATVSGVTEDLYLPDVIDNAIAMSGKNKSHESIAITKEYEISPCIVSEKSKLLQIMINLLLNAKDAIIQHANAVDPHIIVSIKQSTHELIQVIVRDNGIGIAPEIMPKLFTFGFTTKKNGHGFGLHSSALVAKELGGSLEVKSEGVHQGATFILTLPVKIKSEVSR